MTDDDSTPQDLPSPEDIQELLEYLPIFSDPDFKPVLEWKGGNPDDTGVIQAPFPLYNPIVSEFFSLLAKPCWTDPNYLENIDAFRMNPESVPEASLAEIRSILTWCTRGERLCDGHREAVIEDGTVCKLLRRLREIVYAGAGSTD